MTTSKFALKTMFKIVFLSTGYKVYFASRLFLMTQFYFPPFLAIRKFSTFRLCPVQLCLKMSKFIKEVKLITTVDWYTEGCVFGLLLWT